MFDPTPESPVYANAFDVSEDAQQRERDIKDAADQIARTLFTCIKLNPALVGKRVMWGVQFVDSVVKAWERAESRRRSDLRVLDGDKPAG